MIVIENAPEYAQVGQERVRTLAEQAMSKIFLAAQWHETHGQLHRVTHNYSSKQMKTAISESPVPRTGWDVDASGMHYATENINFRCDAQGTQLHHSTQRGGGACWNLAKKMHETMRCVGRIYAMSKLLYVGTTVSLRLNRKLTK